MDSINLLPSDVFQIMSESTSAGMYVIEGEQFIYVNPAFTNITGYAIDELRNFTFWQWVHQDHKDLVKNRGLQRQTGDTDLPIRYEVKIVSKTGEIKWIEICSSKVKGSKALTGTVIDLTERKKAEAALRETEHRYSAIVEHIQDIIFTCSSSGYFLFISPNVEKYTGYKQHEIIGKHFTEFLHHDDVMQAKFITKTSIENRREFTATTRLVKKNSEVIFIEFRGGIIVGKHSREVECLAGVVRDVTLRVKTENEIVKLNSELERRVEERTSALIESEEKYRALIETSPEGIFVTDMQGNFHMVNQKCLSMLGHNSANEIIGVSAFDYIHSFDAETTKMISNDLLSKGNYSGKFQIVKNSGDVFWVEAKCSLVLGKDGSPKWIMTIMRDLTDEMSEEKKKGEMQKQIYQSNKLASIGTLAAGVAHEINNPLFVAKGFSEVIRDYLTENGLLNKEIIDVIKKQDIAFKRIKEIVDGLREYARQDVNTLENVDLHKAIKTTVSLIETIFEKERIMVTLELRANSSVILGTQGKLQQIVMNFLSNARDAISKRGNSGAIKIETFNRENKVVFKISDNGCGVQKEKMQEIFDPFFTTKEPGKGTGLGLSIVHSIVKAMSGEIHVNSVENVGTTFEIVFPLSASIEMIKVQERPKLGEKLNGSVVVVDDEEDVRDVLKIQLESFGLKVFAVEDGEKALDVLSKEKIDLLITDMKMPRMSGFELINQIHIYKYDVKIIMITGGALQDNTPDEEQFINDHVDDYITKPFSKIELYNKIKTLYKDS